MNTWIRGLGRMMLCVGVVVSAAHPQQSGTQSVEGKRSAAAVVAAALVEQGVEGAWAKFEEMLPGRGTRFLFKQSEFLRLGHKLLGSEDAPKAVAVLEMAAQAFPDSYNVFVSLGRRV